MSLDNAAMTVYGDSISGNCLKVRFVADRLGIPYTWVETSVLEKQTRTGEFLAMNPAGQVPLVKFADGRVLAQSNAILRYSREEILKAVQPWTCSRCGNRNPSSNSTCLLCRTPKSSQLPRTGSTPPPLPAQ